VQAKNSLTRTRMTACPPPGWCTIASVERWYRRFTLAPGMRVDSQATRLHLTAAWSQ